MGERPIAGRQQRLASVCILLKLGDRGAPHQLPMLPRPNPDDLACVGDRLWSIEGGSLCLGAVQRFDFSPLRLVWKFGPAKPLRCCPSRSHPARMRVSEVGRTDVMLIGARHASSLRNKGVEVEMPPDRLQSKDLAVMLRPQLGKLRNVRRSNYRQDYSAIECSSSRDLVHANFSVIDCKTNRVSSRGDFHDNFVALIRIHSLPRLLSPRHCPSI
jgi:hypothetical protein